MPLPRLSEDEIWSATHAVRRTVADLLAGLTPEQWATRSLVPEWTVREVAAHVTLSAKVTPLTGLRDLVLARGSFHRMIHDTAVKAACRPTGEIVAGWVEATTSRRQPPGTKPLDPLNDTFVHGQDIAVPLGVDLPLPVAPTAAAVGHIYRRGFPFPVPKKLAGLTLVATDAEIRLGDGPEVHGTSTDLLMLLNGRTVWLDRLTGPGAGAARSRVTA